jgi:hypothetical protein
VITDPDDVSLIGSAFLLGLVLVVALIIATTVALASVLGGSATMTETFMGWLLWFLGGSAAIYGVFCLLYYGTKVGLALQHWLPAAG